MNMGKRIAAFLLAGICFYGAYFCKQARDDAMRELHRREMRAQATVLDFNRRVKGGGGCWVHVIFKDEKGVAYFFGWPTLYNKAQAMFNDARIIVKSDLPLYMHRQSLFTPCSKVAVVKVAYPKNKPGEAIIVNERRFSIAPTVAFIAGVLFFLIGIFRPDLLKGRNE
jgi:hypothetical protein